MELEYQLHFASRLYAWSADIDAAQKLHELRSSVMPSNHEERKLRIMNLPRELAAKNMERDVNNYELRKPYFEKYPQLLLLHSALFRIRHWYCIYGVDERPILYELATKDAVERLIKDLSQDTDALRVLSTYAINTMYLYEKLYAPDQNITRPALIRKLSKAYDLTSKKDIQLLFYLYTHAILGESLFYYQRISRNLSEYVHMLKELEAIMATNFIDINLDNKFEFLVCARLCGFTSTHKATIYEEAASSLHPEGFLVDTHNHNINPLKQDFMMSEHRNVLYLMSLSDPLFYNQPVL